MLDTVFIARIVRERSEGRGAIMISIAGCAWIKGHCDYVVAPDDSLRTGFTVGDPSPTVIGTPAAEFLRKMYRP